MPTLGMYLPGNSSLSGNLRHMTFFRTAASPLHGMHPWDTMSHIERVC